jgi:hypothetical protein
MKEEVNFEEKWDEPQIESTQNALAWSQMQYNVENTILIQTSRYGENFATLRSAFGNTQGGKTGYCPRG